MLRIKCPIVLIRYDSERHGEFNWDATLEIVPFKYHQIQRVGVVVRILVSSWRA